MRIAGRAVSVIVCCTFVGALSAIALAGEQKAAAKLTGPERARNVESFEEAWQTIRDQHWDPDLGGMDWEAVRGEVQPRVEGAQTRSDYLNAMNGMIDRFGQSHFAVVPSQVYDQMQGAAGEGPNDGATGIDVRVIDGSVLVTKVDRGSPAAKSGVKLGWEILRIDGKALGPAIAEAEETFGNKTMLDLVRHRVATGRLAGAVGGSKSVEFRKGSGETATLDIKLVAQKGAKFRLGIFPRSYVWFESEKLEGNVGYIAFNGFMDPVRLMPAFEEAVKSFLDCEGIIIDLRGNGGGLPGMAMGMTGWLVDSDEEYLGTMKLRGAELRLVVNPRLETFNGPVAVLIDGSSASCSEILAGGLRDLDRARLFGVRTAGAVLPAKFSKLPNGDFFYYPIADYFSRSGDRLEGVGVEPDVQAPHRRDALLEGRDVAIQEAKQWIQSQ